MRHTIIDDRFATRIDEREATELGEALARQIELVDGLQLRLEDARDAAIDARADLILAPDPIASRRAANRVLDAEDEARALAGLLFAAVNRERELHTECEFYGV